MAPKEGNKVIQLYFEIKNNGDRDEIVSMFEFNCYADDQACDTFLFSNKDDSLSSATISKGRTTKGSIYFEVPKNAASIEVEYETNFWTDKKAVFIVK